ncbi:RNA-binding cell elongation regulator Jag/EloR [Enterococcus sp. BWR-S5]|uniref:RNA-binding cell elongation regulator Jag/EloR n=1 Tax=Enterococcus sp. BWR-S5 TaxID=2787714 RepID=UPI001922FB06|nr:RNA-binding cell elongation regulator Jag/EloR [Enterococcus sp. BWR-S5]MBL1225473.1 protein jag [Enterococcus sp. BWR-S5]
MPVYEGNTTEEAIANGLRALQLKKDAVEITILSEAKKGFLGFGKKAAQVSIEPTVSEQVSEAVEETVEAVTATEEEVAMKEAVEQTVDVSPSSTAEQRKVLENLTDEEAITELALYLTNISKELNAPAMVRLERTADNMIFHLDTDKPGILIGKHGKVLNAMQYLAQVFIHRAASNKLSVVVNVGDYREKRQAILKRLAERTAEKVKRTGQPVFLEPMPAFERKQIHFTLSKDDYIKTHSEGDEPYRYLVVEPVKKYY